MTVARFTRLGLREFCAKSQIGKSTGFLKGDRLRDVYKRQELYRQLNSIIPEMFTPESAGAVVNALSALVDALEDPDALQVHVAPLIAALQQAIDNLDLAVTASSDKATYEPNETITVTIHTNAGIEKPYLVSEAGYGLATTRSKTENPDGTITWTLTFSLATKQCKNNAHYKICNRKTAV